MSKEKKFQQKRKLWYRGIKKIMHIRYKQPEFIYLGHKFTEPTIIISNHEGTDAPMSLELYADFPIRFWGTSEMNSGLIKMYKYQTKVYYHEKKHWNLFGARMFCLLASPLTNLFYKGLNLISTYKDAQFITTIRESIKTLNEGNNIVIFPEKSPDGYEATLTDFYNGFIMLAEVCSRRGMDLPICPAYYKIKEKQYIFAEPIKFSKLKAEFGTREKISKHLLDICNSLGQMQFPIKSKKDKKQ